MEIATKDLPWDRASTPSSMIATSNMVRSPNQQHQSERRMPGLELQLGPVGTEPSSTAVMMAYSENRISQLNQQGTRMMV
jgi:hypothetical protein